MRKLFSFLGKLILCTLPLLLTPVWGYLIADGYLNFGAGEKDLFLLVPWMVWALLYLVIFIGAWTKRKNMKIALLYSVVGATGILVLVWMVFFIWFNHILGIYKG
jgi:hypothetical protein